MESNERVLKPARAWKRKHLAEAAVVERCRDAILTVVPGATIILYGSRARGEAEAESDYDLLVLVDDQVTLKLEQELRRVIMPIELVENVVISLLPYQRLQWDAPLCRAMPLHEIIDAERVPL